MQSQDLQSTLDRKICYIFKLCIWLINSDSMNIMERKEIPDIAIRLLHVYICEHTYTYTHTHARTYRKNKDHVWYWYNNSIYYCQLNQILLIVIINHTSIHHVPLIDSVVVFFSNTWIKWRKNPPSIILLKMSNHFFVCLFHRIWMWPWET